MKNLEIIGDITLNLDYWDCECDKNYIHSQKEEKCEICGYSQEECPNSRENEVREYIK